MDLSLMFFSAQERPASTYEFVLNAACLVLPPHDHVVSEGWPLRILTREVAALYAAYVHGHSSSLTESPNQYADCALWLQSWPQSQTLAQQMKHWKSRLVGIPPALDLPADRARPTVQGFRGASVPFSLSFELSDALASLSRQQGATLYMTLLAAFKALLARYSGQTDVMVGSAIAGRRRHELEALIGFFVNTLALPGLQLTRLAAKRSAAKFDLSAHLVERQSGPRGHFEQATDLFDLETVERMVQQYERFLAQVVTEPHRRLSELSSLSGVERYQLLSLLSETARDYPREFGERSNQNIAHLESSAHFEAPSPDVTFPLHVDSDTIEGLGRLISNAGSADYIRIMFEELERIVQIDTLHAAMWTVDADCTRITSTQWFSSMPYELADHSKNPLRRCIESADRDDSTLRSILVTDGPQLICSEKQAPRECIVVSRNGTNRFVICLQRSRASGVYSSEELGLIQALSKVLLPLLEQHALQSSTHASLDGGSVSAIEQEFQLRIQKLGLTLSLREREVCVRMLSGFSLPEICERLNIKASTAETYVKRAGLKLGFSGRHGLSRWMIGASNN